ncbi:MAG: cupin domain-containing protein, partial [Rubrobacter sp.]|nr:cupin domain-containing protein [Rubrobacter sp.]
MLPQGEAPPQIHQREDESLYVLEGEFEFLDRDQWIKAAPDSFVR